MSSNARGRVDNGKAKGLKKALTSPIGAGAPMKVLVAKCPRKRKQRVRIATIAVQAAYPLDDYDAVLPEWAHDRAAVRPACIRMGTALRLDIVLSSDEEPEGAATFGMRARLDTPDGVSLTHQITRHDCAVGAGLMAAFSVDIAAPLHAGITVTTLRLDQFSLTDNANVTLVRNNLVSLTIFTIFGPPIRDNVRETTLYDADRDAIPDNDPVVRDAPFFTAAHLMLACGWAGGVAALNQHGIVKSVVHAIPEITYAEDDTYVATNDGWNVWDSPTMRSGDCSQQASFFADVLGTLGIRAVDFELKCDTTVANVRYRRAFIADDGTTWPTHGILLVNYGGDGMVTYDTTFNDPRRVCTLAEATTIGPGQYIENWFEWWMLDDDGQPSRDDVPDEAKDALGLIDDDWWSTRMQELALARFPYTDRQ